VADAIVDFDAISAAAKRIAPFVHRTPVLTSRSLDEWLGCRAFVKAEHLQRTGAFKYRGATNAVQSLPDEVAARGVAAHSSGNHAAALALAAATRGIPCTVVMPHDAAPVKRAAVERYGARVVETENLLDAREAGVRAVIEQTGAVEIHPYDNPDVIAGAGTAALELCEEVDGLDVVVTPIGGGGLASGTCLAIHGVDRGLRFVGGEPQLADDAARSLETGVRQAAIPPATIADGLLTSLSERTFSILREHDARVVVVAEDEIVAAMRAVWERMKQLIEPSAAVAFAAVRQADFDQRRVGIISSGGNVDLDKLPWARAGA
jgi:threonine dehydratase/serine racemase